MMRWPGFRLMLYFVAVMLTIRSSSHTDAAEGFDLPAPLSPLNALVAGDDDDEANEPPSPDSKTGAQTEADMLRAELKQIRTRLQLLEKQQTDAAKAKKPDEKKDEKKAETKKDDSKLSAVWTDMSTDKWTVRLGGHVQMDFVDWAGTSHNIPAVGSQPGDQNYFEFRRLRLVADGTGYGVYDFRLQMTLEHTPTADINPVNTNVSPLVKDAYFSINEIPGVGRVRIGNFFVPFGLEQVTNDTNNIFMERSIPTQGIFTADRQVGLATYNCTEDQRLTWSSGVFLDSISEATKDSIDDNQGYRVAGRVTYLPYYDEPSNGRYLVHTGAGILFTEDQDHSIRFRARPQIHLGPRLIDSGAINGPSYTTGNLEAAVVWGQFTLQSEAFLCSVNRSSGGARSLYGSYIHCSYFLTGENRIYERFGQHGAQFGRNVPINNVFAVPGGISLGAWEMKARWSLLDMHELKAGDYNDFTFGFNWYWSDRTRVMFDWIHPITSSKTTFGAGSADIIAMRFDFNW